MERRDVGLLEVKLDAAAGILSGYGAAFGNVDSYGDVIKRGAFKRTLEEWKERGKLPKMLLQHGGWGMTSDDMMPVGQWTAMEENSKGLKVEGRIFALNTERGQYIYEGLKSGELDSLSIGFKTRAYERDEENDVRTLTDVDLWEVSIVTFPANEKAQITSVKQNISIEQLREIEGRLRDEGFSRRQAVTALSVLKPWLQSDAGAPSGDPPRDVADSATERELLATINRAGGFLMKEALRRT